MPSTFVFNKILILVGSVFITSCFGIRMMPDGDTRDTLTIIPLSIGEGLETFKKLVGSLSYLLIGEFCLLWRTPLQRGIMIIIMYIVFTLSLMTMSMLPLILSM